MSDWTALLRLPTRRATLAERVLAEVRVARTDLRQGRFERSMALMTAFSAVVSGWEAYAQHQRGAYAHRLMWTPVWLTPPTVLAALAALVNERAARRVLPVLSLVSLMDGFVGFYYHLRGIQRLPGGFGLGRYNVVIGPPIFAPLLTCMIGVLGLLAGLLRRERLTPTARGARLLLLAADILAAQRSPATLPERLAASISHGRFQRGFALIAAVFAVLAGAEAYFEHLRGSFNRPVMWTPIWVTPPMVVAAIGAACSERVAREVLPLASAVTFLDGVLGFGLHMQGIRRMPGGFDNLQFNMTMGPPVFAPLLFCSVGLLGFIASLVRRREG
jgi:hypothetical protein